LPRHAGVGGLHRGRRAGRDGNRNDLVRLCQVVDLVASGLNLTGVGTGRTCPEVNTRLSADPHAGDNQGQPRRGLATKVAGTPEHQRRSATSQRHQVWGYLLARVSQGQRPNVSRWCAGASGSWLLSGSPASAPGTCGPLGEPMTKGCSSHVRPRQQPPKRLTTARPRLVTACDTQDARHERCQVKHGREGQLRLPSPRSALLQTRWSSSLTTACPPAVQAHGQGRQPDQRGRDAVRLRDQQQRSPA
jgi:hypothetical protein